MSLPKELKFERLTIEEKYYRAVPGYMKRLCSLYEAIYERFGEDGLDLIRGVSRKFGAGIGTNINKRRKLKGIAQVGKYILRVFDMISDDWQVSEFSENRLVITVSRCPYPFKNDEICQAHTCMEKNLIAALDSNLEYHIGQSIPKGDPYCEHILCVKTDHD
ncbi:L-2-amino-thiazoline-4-carboxylic acid hydrolase [bacterium]|nr:L-2-amino-thiazoline-4-carboxylic acid hydrolase [bacterium]MBU1651095.1 L-2-amino-thiazoline-4-carboxylic acid hydrolase [bacterium]